MSARGGKQALVSANTDPVKTLHTYLTRQVIASLLMTVAVFTFVLLLGNVLKEILALLVGGQVSLMAVIKAIGLLIPFVLVFALPMGMLTATLLVFGRFSADHELTAARASGISLISLAAPILWLSLALCGVCAAVNLYVGPASRVAYKDLIASVKVQLASAALPAGRFITDIPGCLIYVGKNDGRNLKDIMLYLLQEETNVVTKIRAPHGFYQYNPTNQLFELTLQDFRSVTLINGRWINLNGESWPIRTNLTALARGPTSVSISDMTFDQLRAELRDAETRVPMPATSTNLSETDLRAQREFAQRQLEDLTLPYRVQINRQVAFSFACFGFTLIGIPLGIRMHRRETNVGVAVALLLVMVYYAFIGVAQALQTRPEWSPQLILWIPNFIFQAVGAVLLWRANKGI